MAKRHRIETKLMVLWISLLRCNDPGLVCSLLHHSTFSHTLRGALSPFDPLPTPSRYLKRRSSWLIRRICVPIAEVIERTKSEAEKPRKSSSRPYPIKLKVMLTEASALQIDDGGMPIIKSECRPRIGETIEKSVERRKKAHG